MRKILYILILAQWLCSCDKSAPIGGYEQLFGATWSGQVVSQCTTNGEISTTTQHISVLFDKSSLYVSNLYGYTYTNVQYNNGDDDWRVQALYDNDETSAVLMIIRRLGDDEIHVLIDASYSHDGTSQREQFDGRLLRNGRNR